MKRISVCDSSLLRVPSDGAVALSFKEKLEIAKRLAELNVDVIELNPFNSGKADEILVKTVCNVVKNSVVSCVAGSTEEQVETAYSLIAAAKKKRLNIIMPVSPVQMEYFVSKKPALVTELLKTLTEKAVSLCDDVEVTLSDATRAEPEFLYGAVKIAVDCGAKTVSLIDLAGTMMPAEYSEFIENLYKAVPAAKDINVTVGVSDALEMGVANAMSAVLSGVDGVKLSALKTDALPSIEKFSAAMENIGVKKGYDTNLNKTAINRLVGKIRDMAVGRNGKITENSQEKAEVVSKKTTIEEFKKTVADLGYELGAEDIKKVYEEFIRLSEKKDVSVRELETIIATSALQVPETYSLVSFSVNSSNVLSATASVVLKKKGKTLSGLSYGNGPVDAAFLAIESVVGRHFELDEFELGAVTEGKEAMGQAIVKLRYNGALYSGKGLSTDIIGASIRAYVGAINKIVYEENK